MDKLTLIKYLNLEPHIEGGFYRRTYQSTIKLNDHYITTSIYYLLTNESPIGHFHVNKSDIIHYFHLGSPISYLTISPVGELDHFTLGTNLKAGHVLQKVVHGGYWKASILEHGEFGLISEAVTPGFDFNDMTIGTPKLLQEQFPLLWEKIKPFVKKT